MSTHANSPDLSFSPAITPDCLLTNEPAFAATHITAHILALTTFLLSLESHTTFFGSTASTHRPPAPNLRVLYTRLTTGHLPPQPQPLRFLTGAHVEASTRAGAAHSSEELAQRPLAHFEDVYYALLARVREMQKRMRDHVDSGFSTPETPVFEGGPTIAALHGSLAAYWAVLNAAGCGKAMDEAVREARVQCLQEEIVAQVRGNRMGVREGEAQIRQLREREVYRMQSGLDWTPEWDVAIVNAKLREKYRGVLLGGGGSRRRETRMERLERVALRKKRKRKRMGRGEAGEKRMEDQVMGGSEQDGTDAALHEGFGVDVPVQPQPELSQHADNVQHARQPQHLGLFQQPNPTYNDQAAQYDGQADTQSTKHSASFAQNLQKEEAYAIQAAEAAAAAAAPHLQHNPRQPLQTADQILYAQHMSRDQPPHDSELHAQRQRVSLYSDYLREHASDQVRSVMGYF